LQTQNSRAPFGTRLLLIHLVFGLSPEMLRA
jgi:hypothetical protein